MSESKALARLCREYGVQTSFRDVWQRRRAADPEVLAGVLRALGAPILKPADASAALKEIDARRSRRAVAPALVVWDGSPISVDLDLPAPLAGAPIDFEIEIAPTEGQADPELRTIRATAFPAGGPAAIGPAGGRVPCRATIPGTLPHGVHRIRFEIGDATHECLLLAAPGRVPDPEDGASWGMFLPLYSARSGTNWGIGDFSDLARLAEWTGAKGGGVLGTLPLLASFLDEPCDHSPYMPASRLFLNEIFVDVAAVPEFASCAKAREIAASPEFLAGLEAGRRGDHVDYRVLMGMKRRVLMELSLHVARSAPDRLAALRRYAASRPAAVDYARFRAAVEKERTGWQGWPAGWREGRIREEEVDPDVERYHLYAQWIAEEQMSAAAAAARVAKVRLYHDFPLGVHPSGYDTWREREAFLNGMAVGAPPDHVWSGGQNWGFPPLHPERFRSHDYRYLRAAFRQSLRHAGLLRVDHIMGFHRLYVIPEGGTAKEGVYLRYPAEENYALLAMEAHRAGCAIVGEDLGTVPAAVRTTMGKHALHRMYVGQREFLLHPDRPFAGIPAAALACLNTHDMPPFAGFWDGALPEVRHEMGLIDAAALEEERIRLEEAKRLLVEDLRGGGWMNGAVSSREACHGCLRRLAASRARIVLVNLEDLWEETRPQNVPGTWKERPNWQRKARIDLDSIRTDSGPAALLAEIADLRRRAHGGRPS